MSKTCNLSQYPVRFDAKQNTIKGYLAIWGDSETRDCYFTWFDKDHPPHLDLDFLPVPLLYEHNVLHEDLSMAKLGRVTQAGFDDKGIWYIAELDPKAPLHKRVVSEIQEGKLATSSGSAPHLVKFDKDGRFEDWHLVEVSLTQTPCEERMPAVSLVRSQPTMITELALAIGANLARQGGACRCGCKDHNARAGEHLPAPSQRIFRMTLEEMGLGEMSSPDIVTQLVSTYGDWVATVYNEVFTEGALEQAPEMLVDAAVALYPEADIEALGGLVFALYALLTEREDGANALAAAIGGAETEMMEEEMLSAPQPAYSLKPITATPPARGELPTPTLQAEFERRLAAIEQDRAKERQARAYAPATTPNLPQTPRKDTPMQGSSIRNVVDRKYDALTLMELQLMFEMLRADRRTLHSVDFDPLVRALSYKMENRIRASSAVRSAFYERGLPTNAAQLYHSLMDGGRLREAAIRANELTSETNNSTWVGTSYSDQLWEKIRSERIYATMVAAGMREVEIPQGSQTFKILAEGADLGVYYATESISASAAAGIPTAITPIGTYADSVKTITPSKLGARIMYTGELIEDQFVPVMPNYNDRILRDMAAAIELVMILGDTTSGATGNINSDDGAPSATAPYMAMKGFVRTAFDNSLTVAAGTLEAADFLAVRSLLGRNSPRQDEIVFLSDYQTYNKALGLAEFETVDVFGGEATVKTGGLQKVYGSMYLASDQMGLAEADGKASTTPANNTSGRLVAVAASRWTVGWKRRVTIRSQEWAGADVTEFAAFARFGLATADSYPSALGYNITV